MKIFNHFILLILITTSLIANVENDIHMGISISKKTEAQQRKINSVLKKMSIEVNKFFNEQIYIETIDSPENVVKKFEEFKKVNVIIIYPNTYLEHMDELKKTSQNLFVISGSEKFTQFYLIANKKSKIKKLEDLKNKKFITSKGSDSYINWLDYITRKNLKKKYDNIISEKILSDKEPRLIYDTFFGKADFTVVSKKIYDDMIIFNPSIEKNLIIIKKSEPIFMHAIGLVNKNTPKKIVKTLNKILFDKKFKYAFKHTLKLLNNSTIKKIDIKDLNSLEKFHNSYIKLKASAVTK